MQTKVVLWNKIGHEEQGMKHKLDLIRFMATESKDKPSKKEDKRSKHQKRYDRYERHVRNWFNKWYRFRHR